ncbi:MAG: transposase family protein [Actinomycetota bacterium]|nr:transposase family protein [Actinomycetota bacterium]
MALLGLAGFVLLDAVEEDGELHLAVETTASRATCPECGVFARSKGRKVVQVRDMPAGGRPVRLWWRKRRWFCPDSDCENKTWSEQAPAIRARAVLTERAGREICTRVGRDAASVAEMAREYLVAWSTAMAVLESHGRPLVDDPDRIGNVAELGVDETAFVRSGPGRRRGFVTGMVDLERHRLLDVTRGRSGADLRTRRLLAPATVHNVPISGTPKRMQNIASDGFQGDPIDGSRSDGTAQNAPTEHVWAVPRPLETRPRRVVVWSPFRPPQSARHRCVACPIVSCRPWTDSELCL